jgi:hypothetical protein
VSAATVADNEPSRSSAAVAAPPAVAPPATDRPTSAAPTCEKCRAPLGGGSTSICRKCGWYSVAKVYVELDRTWEQDAEAKPAKRDDRLPWWAWVAIASVIAVIIESALVRGLTPDGSQLRTTWSGIQFLGGIAAFLAAQVVGFVILMRNDATAALLDVLLKPFKVSAMLFRELPKRFWIVDAGICGLVAALSAVVIIGSVPYHVLWSWNVDYNSTQHLTDALSQEMGAKGVAIEAPPESDRTVIDAVIIGYELSDAGNIRVVLVARESYGKLMYAGGVEPTGDPAQLFELRENLMAIPSRGPVIPMTFNSNWVLPKYTCQISYAFEQDNKKLTDIRWEGEVRGLRMPGE